jgi:hypothetical protein
MPTVNNVMTVEQMLNIMTFLNPRYVKLQSLYRDIYWEGASANPIPTTTTRQHSPATSRALPSPWISA